MNINQALERSDAAIDELRDSLKAIDIALTKLFPDGCPREAGPQLGAWNALSNAGNRIDSAIAAIGDCREHLVRELPGGEPLEWLNP